MKYKYLLNKILTEGTFVKREFSLISLYNYNLEINNYSLEHIINIIPEKRREKFETEFNLFLKGEKEVKKYNEKNINYWNYIGEKFINSYPDYYPKFNKIQEEFKENSKNHILFLGNNEYSNQQCCMSTIQFQKNNNKLYITVLQRSCDANLGFLSDIYHLSLFAKKLNTPIENINILYGNLHIYENNIGETQRYIMESGTNNPYKFIQNNKVR